MVFWSIKTQFFGDGAHEARTSVVDLLQLHAVPFLPSFFSDQKTRGAVVRLSVASRLIT